MGKPHSTDVIKTHRPRLQWTKFSRSKVAQQVLDPLADLNKPSEHRVQLDAKRKLREHIEARKDGFSLN